MSHAIVLFDGTCNFCDASVNFIIDRDPAGNFKFAALESETGQRLLRAHGLHENRPDSLVLVEDGKAYTRSSAALRIAAHMRFPWPLLEFFLLVPPFLRNAAYDWVARRRYQWFGRRESCRIPTPEIRERFLV
jgi:predicted DCC family thiol-disulfide oxidoreductase YuxK